MSNPWSKYRRFQVSPSESVFKIISSIAVIENKRETVVIKKILSQYCERISPSERQMLIDRFDSNAEASHN